MRMQALYVSLFLASSLWSLAPVRAQSRADEGASGWWSKEYLRAQREMDAYQKHHHLTKEQSAALGIREFNASLARRQIYLIKKEQTAAEAYGRAIAATPQPPLDKMLALEAKVRNAQTAVANGWKIIHAMRDHQAKERAQGQLLDDMLNGR